MTPTLTRRRLLTCAGVGAGALLGAGSVQGTPPHVRVFVHPDDNAAATAAAAARDNGGTVIHTYDNFPFVASRLPAKNVDDLRGDRRVRAVEADGRVRALHHKEGHDGGGGGGGGGGGNGGGDDDGTDDGCGDQPPQEPSWGHGRIGADAVSGATGAGVDIAVLDTGIDADHCDLKANVQGGINCTGKGGNSFDDKDGHGTHCAGVAAAADNALGVVGVAPEANLYAVKVLGNNGSGNWSDVVRGVDWCMSTGREVLSMSFGSSTYSDAVRTALAEARAAGHVLVAAAGNAGNDEDGHCEEKNVDQPARDPNVIAVGAIEETERGGSLLAGYSSVGDYSDPGMEVQLVAPGTAIRSTARGNGYETRSGTSMACPHVAGVAALAWEAAGASLGGSDTEAVVTAMFDTGETVTGTCEEGNGLVRADGTVDELLA